VKPFKLDPNHDWTNDLGMTREEIEEGMDILAETNERLKRENAGKPPKPLPRWLGTVPPTPPPPTDH
jgi:hypothetical protein